MGCHETVVDPAESIDIPTEHGLGGGADVWWALAIAVGHLPTYSIKDFDLEAVSGVVAGLDANLAERVRAAAEAW